MKSKIVASDKVSPEAVTAAKKAIDDMFKNVDPVVLKKLAEKPYKIYIFAEDSNLTDLPERGFTDRKEKFCGKQLCKEAAGITLPESEGGHIAIAEGNLLGEGKDPAKYTLLHELAHKVMDQGLPAGPPWLWPRFRNTLAAYLAGRAKGTGLIDAEAAWNPPSVKRITKLYNQYMKEGDTGIGPYANQFDYENFAQAVTIYFDVGYDADLDKMPDASVLQLAQPEMFTMLGTIFGPSRNLSK
jgi:hypothetical protein